MLKLVVHRASLRLKRLKHTKYIREKVFFFWGGGHLSKYDLKTFSSPRSYFNGGCVRYFNVNFDILITKFFSSYLSSPRRKRSVHEGVVASLISRCRLTKVHNHKKGVNC